MVGGKWQCSPTKATPRLVRVAKKRVHLSNIQINMIAER